MTASLNERYPPDRRDVREIHSEVVARFGVALASANRSCNRSFSSHAPASGASALTVAIASGEVDRVEATARLRALLGLGRRRR